jgi:hypothetical protein
MQKTGDILLNALLFFCLWYAPWINSPAILTVASFTASATIFQMSVQRILYPCALCQLPFLQSKIHR